MSKRGHTISSIGGSPVRKDPSFGGFSKLGSIDATGHASSALFGRNSQPKSTPIPKGGVHVHIQQQSMTVTDSSPPTTFQTQTRNRYFPARPEGLEDVFGSRSIDTHEGTDESVVHAI